MTTPTAAEIALQERDFLARRYRLAKSRELEELLAGKDGYGLARWQADIKRAKTPDEMIDAVCANSNWFARASNDAQYAALSILSRRIVQIRERAGLPPFDDPMPHEDDDVRRVCLKELGR